jgi:hypothetical protein
MELPLQKLDGVNNSSDSKLQIKERVNVSITRSMDGSILLLKNIPIYEGYDVEEALWDLKEVVPREYYFNPKHDSWMCFEDEGTFVSYTFGAGDKIEKEYSTVVKSTKMSLSFRIHPKRDKAGDFTNEETSIIAHTWTKVLGGKRKFLSQSTGVYCKPDDWNPKKQKT